MSDISISKERLQDALLQWERSARDGKWQATPELPAEEVAAANAEYLWGLLQSDSGAIPRSDFTGEQLEAAYKA